MHRRGVRAKAWRRRWLDLAFGVLILLMTALMLAQMAEIAVTVATVATVAVVRAAAAAFEAIASADQRAFAWQRPERRRRSET